MGTWAKVDGVFWQAPDTLVALRNRDFGRLFRLLSAATGVSQTAIGAATGLSQGQVSQVMNGARRLTQLAVIERVCDGLDMPDPARMLLGLAPGVSPRPEVSSALVPPTVGLAELVTRDVRGDVGAVTLSCRSVGFVAPSRDWLVAIASASGAPASAASPSAMALHGAFTMFQEMDTRFGGAYTHATLAQYLRLQVTPLLNASAAEPARRDVFSAAAELVYLAGLTSVDSGACGLGQRYFVQALALAREAGETDFGANVLAAMATLALTHRNATEAVQLAKAGMVGARQVGNHALAMRLNLALARGHARAGEPVAAGQALNRAETALERVTDPARRAWTRFLDRAYLLGETATCLLDLGCGQQAAAMAEESANAYTGRQRRLILSHATRATALGPHGDPDVADIALTEALDLLGPVQSSRTIRALNDAVAAMNRHRRDSPGLSRAHAVLGRPTGRCCPYLPLAS
jgi:transcriptional regulator with XRE-family HTH domain